MYFLGYKFVLKVGKFGDSKAQIVEKHLFNGGFALSHVPNKQELGCI